MRRLKSFKKVKVFYITLKYSKKKDSKNSTFDTKSWYFCILWTSFSKPGKWNESRQKRWYVSRKWNGKSIFRSLLQISLITKYMLFLFRLWSVLWFFGKWYSDSWKKKNFAKCHLTKFKWSVAPIYLPQNLLSQSILSSIIQT